MNHHQFAKGDSLLAMKALEMVYGPNTGLLYERISQFADIYVSTLEDSWSRSQDKSVDARIKCQDQARAALVGSISEQEMVAINEANEAENRRLDDFAKTLNTKNPIKANTENTIINLIVDLTNNGKNRITF